MAALDPNFFRGGETLSGRDLALAELGTFSDIGRVLSNFGWDGKPSGCIVLGLSSDNKRVTGASFCLIGQLEDRDLKIDISKLWQSGAANTMLILRGIEGQSFTFEEGGMWSDLRQDDEVDHFFSDLTEGRAPSTVLQADYERAGIQRFCVRMNCYLSKNSSKEKGLLAKYQVLIFPGTREELLSKSQLVKKGEWPGIKLGEGEMPIGPAAKAAWGCPIMPLLMPGTRFAQLGSAPSMDKLRRAIGGVLGRAVVPETSKTGASLATRWARLGRHPEESGAKKPTVTWPEPRGPEPEQGKN